MIASAAFSRIVSANMIDLQIVQPNTAPRLVDLHEGTLGKMAPFVELRPECLPTGSARSLRARASLPAELRVPRTCPAILLCLLGEALRLLAREQAATGRTRE